MDEAKYKGTFNWHGEIHELWTVARSKIEARVHFMSKLSKMLDRSIGIVDHYFKNTANSFTIERKGE